jgi:molybdate transport system regulatory protein
MALWVVTGAASGVGKTYIAKQLCAVLPSTMYAKLGHHPPKRGKSANYFTERADLQAFIKEHRAAHEHVVVESNSFKPRSKGAVVIFIAAPPDNDDLRGDAVELSRRANIRVDGEDGREEWEPVVKAAAGNEDLTDAVLAILSEQTRRLTCSKLSVRSKVWFINQDKEHVFGSGLASLVEDVEHLGSLKAAAESSGMSYRHAWGAIKDAEKNLGFKLLMPSAGGSGGGGSLLSPEAKHVLAVYRRLNECASAVADAEFAKVKDWEYADG